MTQYNKTPWWIEVDGEETWIEGQTHTVCECVSNEDAERIVHCVNNHERLVNNLKSMVGQFDAEECNNSETDWMVINEARTLLATLEAEKGGEL